MRLLARSSLTLFLTLVAACRQAEAPRRPAEILVYIGGSGERALESFRAHADQISIVAPQAFWVDSLGRVEGGVDAELLAIAREGGVEVMPLIVNPGFEQAVIHALLADSAARRRTVDALVALAAEHAFYGWQFDFENIHVSDRAALTRFYGEAADALHAAGYRISIAVVPTDGSEGETPFHRYMQSNWRNGFDVAALAELGDFVSWMTYAQHGGPTAPGPIAGLRWVRTMVEYALGQGVRPEKLSFGIPTYSGHWFPTYDEARGARVVGREIPYARARELLEAAGSEPRWLPERGAHYAFWANDGIFEWLFLEDRRSLAAKLDLFDAYPGLRGLSLWVLGAEDPGIWSVLEKRTELRRASR